MGIVFIKHDYTQFGVGTPFVVALPRGRGSVCNCVVISDSHSGGVLWPFGCWHWSEIVGAYRLGPSDEILPRAGVKGLYTSSLFHWNDGFLRRTGPVSISNKYTVAARELMVTYLNAFRRSPELAPLVRARPSRLAKELVGGTVWDMEELSTLVADVESDHKGMPVLLRQYLKLGGELAAFHVDRKFANALDGLIVVDLAKTDVRLLERYLGKEGAAIFAKEGTSARRVSYPDA
jgi:hypothetical protein